MTANTVFDIGSEENQGINVVELVVSENSKITNVCLYSGRAEVTHLSEVTIKAGQNKIAVVGLPREFQENSLRVEGQGNASIHDVFVEKITNLPSAQVTGNQAENALGRQRREIEDNLNSAEKSRATLNGYLDTISANDYDISRMGAILEGYMELSRKVDKQILDLEKDLADVMTQIQEEKYANQAAFTPTQFWKACIDIAGQIEKVIKLRITYAVYQADWTASYDIRVDAQAKEKAVTILYKAIITQNTGESWNSVPLTLETVTPSFGIKPPVLHLWRVSAYQQPRAMPGMSAMNLAQDPVLVPIHRSRSRSHSPSSFSANCSTSYPTLPVFFQPDMVLVSYKGSRSATLQIPGLVNIPSDGRNHNITFAQLILDATLVWYAIPASDARVHMKAQIQNSSKHTFVPGVANIYVDGSFVATTHIPSATPHEVFDCPLGSDTSIRITYHPREKRSVISGFHSKSSTQSFTQRITILNTKPTTIQNLKVIDRVPVSEDERIGVKVLNPALGSPSTNSGAVSKPVQVAHNVIAQWDGMDEPGVDPDAIGKDGKLNWIISSISPQQTISLVLQFEVNYPENIAITGL
ncbi:hypothetical protein CVT25_009810 [Psilocybe cyanescens]|uniref:DUF4139 domain-containing protein n=1 Tax=Psilocybe cyanescens TaxID=93625 RepID=A0A409X893_PSICY|nr:hypothetical protein CVT25_009810 [Psilocybe cyanescens]